MTISESLLVAVFCLSMVFFVLACLCGFVKLFSLGLNAVTGSGQGVKSTEIARSQPNLVQDNEKEEEFSSGNLKLYDVDEPTAAMIMAIVSDESEIPLSELCFKSIQLRK